METERAPLSHSVSLSEPHTTHRRDQVTNIHFPYAILLLYVQEILPIIRGVLTI